MTMKAFVLRSYGPPDHLELADVKIPRPGPGEVLVRVRATSVNPADWHLMRGEPRIARLFPGLLGLRAPKVAILGCDVAGQVEAVGADVTGFRPGDDVFALLDRGGGFAEYACVPERALVRKPARLSFAQAAAVPLAAATALLALADVGGVRPGQQVLVNGAAGGVGTFAVQLARAYGASVAAVCGPAGAELVKSIGAGEVIDYRRQDFTRSGRRYDLLLDIAGGRPAFACRRVLAPDGTLVLVGGLPGRWLEPAGHMFTGLATAPLVRHRVARADIIACPTKQQLLTTLATLLDDGQVVPVIGREYPAADLREAVRYQEQGHPQGKVVVSWEN
jgi:NADPH:quinone reductase-like Zn-dependent oxidoreductase